MKKKTVYLCELCADDIMARNLLHISVCDSHNEKIAALSEVEHLDLTNEVPGSGNGISLNANGKRKRRKDVSDAEKKQMQELRSSGVPLKKVSEMFQVSPSTVTRYANMARR